MKIIDFCKTHKNLIYMILGFLAVSLMVFPALILGTGTYVEIHDQLDGEVLNYIYRGRYLFRGNVIPEFMNGMSKAAMAMPAPFGVVFYRLLPPFVAFMLMQWLAVLTGFAGMYGLCCYLKVKKEIGFMAALLFSYLPFYPVYGLAALGQPLLILCFLRMLNGQRKIFPLLGIVIYAGFSSLTLVGYVWVVLGALAVCYFGLVKKHKIATINGLLAWGTLTVTYLLTNLDVLGSLVGSSFSTHRQEMELLPTEHLLEKGAELLFVGGAYSKVYSSAIMVVALFLLLLRRFHAEEKQERLLYFYKLLKGLLAVVLLGTVLSVLWNCSVVVNVRKSLGGIFCYFQADRVYWTFPFLWMLILAVVLQLLWQKADKQKRKLNSAFWVLMFGLLFIIEGVQIFRDSTLNKNIRLLLVPDYQQVTWESIYMEETFQKIDLVMGAEKEQKSIVSLGMFPSIALYHGYTCADGYSNNYDLEYKHTFRKMIREELVKEEQTKKYFDQWGNRLYLVSAEYGFNAMIGKNSGIIYHDLQLDTEAMKAMNVGYLFAAAPISNAKELGMELLQGSPFSDPTSYYAVWIYKVQ